MEKTPFLTIGIASYNYEKYLLKAFEQIKKQKFTDFEVLYCDDGSTDNSVAVIESFIKENPNMKIRLIQGKNEGILANRNRILENAKGKYLLICDADDSMTEDCLEVLCKAAKEHDADCVIGGFSEIDGQGNAFKTHIPTANANKWIYIWHHAQIYKMDFVQKHGLRFEEIPDDVCFIQRMHQYAKNTVFVSKDIYCWNRHSDSTSSDIDNNSDWHPKNLWKSIVDSMLEIKKSSLGKKDLWQIRYFLCKWFYFNMTDLPVKNKRELKDNIKKLQQDMKLICPNYRNLVFVRRILKEEDTFFAKFAVLACWVLEGLGMIQLLPRIRNWQRKRRV